MSCHGRASRGACVLDVVRRGAARILFRSAIPRWGGLCCARGCRGDCVFGGCEAENRSWDVVMCLQGLCAIFSSTTTTTINIIFCLRLLKEIEVLKERLVSFRFLVTMGKNKEFTNISPVDHYRKQIGKQDYKKSKTELKETKAKAQAKEGVYDTYKDISIMIGSMVAVIGILYALLYIYLDKKEDIDSKI